MQQLTQKKLISNGRGSLESNDNKLHTKQALQHQVSVRPPIEQSYLM